MAKKVRSVHFSSLMLAAAFIAQFAFSHLTQGVKPFWTVLPPAPTERTLAAQSFGDPEFLYRLLVMDLQNFGDTGGRLTPLKNYDMNLVVAWMRALDSLDIDAHHHIMLAALYFGQTQNTPDVLPLVRYIGEHVRRNPEKKLSWLGEAIFLAQVRLKDAALALEIADQLAEYDFPDMRPVAYQLPALVHERAGNFARAAELMAVAAGRLEGRVPNAEMEFMKNYAAAMRSKAGQVE